MTAGCDAEAALSILSEYYDIIRHEGSSSFVGNTIELVPKGFNKAVGIAAVIRLFDIPWEDTIVFGDSNNDLAMFEYAATKVAMGNASPKIKELADYVTSDMFHYGIRENFLSEMILPSGMPPGEFPMPIIPFFPIWYLLYLWELQVCSMLLPTDFSMRQEWQMCFL